jgi:hypothetical protein
MMALTLVSTIGAGGGDSRWYTTPEVIVVGASQVSVITCSGEDREVASIRTPRQPAAPNGPARARRSGTSSDRRSAPDDLLRPQALAAVRRGLHLPPRFGVVLLLRELATGQSSGSLY